MSGMRAKVLLQIMFPLMVASQASEHVTTLPAENPSLDANQTTGSQVPPSGYVAFPEAGLAYKFVHDEDDAVSYFDAISRCSNEGGQVAVIDSEAKVRKILSSFSDLDWAWVGIHKPQSTERWTTVDGKSTNDLPWASKEPRGVVRCVQLSRYWNGLITWSCRGEEGYVCEIAFPRIVPN